MIVAHSRSFKWHRYRRLVMLLKHYVNACSRSCCFEHVVNWYWWSIVDVSLTRWSTCWLLEINSVDQIMVRSVITCVMTWCVVQTVYGAPPVPPLLFEVFWFSHDLARATGWCGWICRRMLHSQSCETGSQLNMRNSIGGAAISVAKQQETTYKLKHGTLSSLRGNFVA